MNEFEVKSFEFKNGNEVLINALNKAEGPIFILVNNNKGGDILEMLHLVDATVKALRSDVDVNYKFTGNNYSCAAVLLNLLIKLKNNHSNLKVEYSGRVHYHRPSFNLSSDDGEIKEKFTLRDDKQAYRDVELKCEKNNWHLEGALVSLEKTLTEYKPMFEQSFSFMLNKIHAGDAPKRQRLERKYISGHYVVFFINDVELFA